jgi:ketosteroid isomerase-like protein
MLRACRRSTTALGVATSTVSLSGWIQTLNGIMTGAPPPPDLYRARRGHDGVRDFFIEIGRDFDFLRFDPVAFLAGDDMVAVPIHFRLRHKATGREFGDLEVHLWTFGSAGQVTRLRHVLDARPFERL